MNEPYGIRGGESFHFTPDPDDEDNETFYANMKAADRHGRIFLVNTGYRCYLTERIYPYRYAMVFDDENGERRVVSYEVIMNVTVGIGDASIAR